MNFFQDGKKTIKWRKDFVAKKKIYETKLNRKHVEWLHNSTLYISRSFQSLFAHSLPEPECLSNKNVGGRKEKEIKRIKIYFK